MSPLSTIHEYSDEYNDEYNGNNDQYMNSNASYVSNEINPEDIPTDENLKKFISYQNDVIKRQSDQLFELANLLESCNKEMMQRREACNCNNNNNNNNKQKTNLGNHRLQFDDFSHTHSARRLKKISIIIAVLIICILLFKYVCPNIKM